MPYIGRAPTSTATKLEDADQDTKIQLEESSDEDTIRFDTGGSERMTVASGGTVDVVGDLTVGTVTADGDTSAGDNATLGYTAALGAILTGQGSTNDVTLVNDADATVLSIPTGTTGVTIANGLTLTDGDVTVASGHGINFAATNDATGATSELFNDYEEGQYIPTVVGSSSGNYALTADTKTFGYTKIGRLVHVQGQIQPSTDNSLSGNCRISLPFTATNASPGGVNEGHGVAIIEHNGSSLAGATTTQVSSNLAYFIIIIAPVDGAGIAILGDATMDAVLNIQVAMSYFAADA